MRKRKRLLILLVAGWIALAGCSGKNEVVDFELPEEAEHTLSFFGNKHEAANVKVIEDILNGYMEEKSEVMITYESLKGKEYYQALRDRAETGRLDDIFMVDHDTVLELSGNGYLADLSSVVEKSSFSQNMLSQMQSEDGNIYWVPTTVSAFGLYCNLDLLKKHGQSVPTNLGEWEAVCDYFISQNITPVIANNDISLKTLAIAKGFYPLYARRGQQEAFDRLNSGQDALSAYLEEGFSLAKTFCDRGYIDAARALTTEKTSDDLEQFAAGEAPFMLTGVWAAGRVRDMSPKLSFQVVPYPVLEDGSVLVINPDVRLSVSQAGENRELAMEFVSYFLKEENIGRFADNQSSFSPLQADFQPSLREVREIVKSYRRRTPVIGADSRLQFPIWDITADAARELLAGEGLEEVMERMDKRVMNSGF